MRRTFWTLVTLGLMAAQISEIKAQNTTQGWGMSSRFNQMFDRKNIVRIDGTVVEVNLAPPLKGMSSGVHLLLNSGKDAHEIHVGPSWYIDNQEVKILKGDKITVTGSKTKIMDKDAIIAETIIKGEQMLVLRDGTGRPLWAGWRRCCNPE